jgi:hypothetical protein
LYRLCLVALALAACSATPYAGIDRAKCASYGFPEGSEGFANCMMTVNETRRAIGGMMVAGNPYLRP